MLWLVVMHRWFYTRNMELLNNLNTIFALIGFPTMLAGFVYFGRKLQVLDTIEHEINHSIKPDIRDLRDRMTAVENRMDGFEMRMSLFEKSLESVKQVVYRNATE